MGPILNTSIFPPRLQQLKAEIASSYPDFEQRVTSAWREILQELETFSDAVSNAGSDYIPQVGLSQITALQPEEIEEIKKKGCLVVRNVVDDAVAEAWKNSLQEFVSVNHVPGEPMEDKQFFHLFWTRPQVEARSDPNVLALTAWLNGLFRNKEKKHLEGVDIATPLTYADRFRLRKPGFEWNVHPPHLDGGSIERWEDETFRQCFKDILSGEWRKHDPYELAARCDAKNSLYKREGQASIFRTFQGWLALSETAPTEGTLQVFPNVVLSNAYLILRPFFRSTVPPESPDILDAKNWEYDISTPDFPGLLTREGHPGYVGPRPTPLTHPHMRLDKTMISVPKVLPGDMVFWQCDVVHAVEKDHTGSDVSAVMYIPAVPLTPQNEAYIQQQSTSFINLEAPRDFGAYRSEKDFVGVGTTEHIVSPVAKRAMGLAF